MTGIRQKGSQGYMRMLGRIRRVLSWTALVLSVLLCGAEGHLLASDAPVKDDLDADNIIRAFSERPEFGSRGKGQVLLRYKFGPGEKIPMNTGLVMDQVIYINDQTIKVRTVMSLEGGCAVESLEEDGTARASMNLTRIRVRTEGPSRVSFDSKKGIEAAEPGFRPLVALAGISIPFKVSALGVVSHVDRKALDNIEPSAGKRSEVFDLRTICDEFLASAFVQLPMLPLETGESYRAHPVVRITPDGDEIRLEEEFKLLALSVNNRQALLQPQGRFEVKDRAEGDKKLRLNYGARGGWVLFDLVKGKVARSGGYSRLDTTLFQNGGSMRMKTHVRMFSSFK